MDIRQLKYFQVIAQEKQITAAANRLNISQPPLSNQLKNLEDELGFALFHRNNKYLELTAEGSLFLEHVNALLLNYDSMLTVTQNIKAGNAGSLFIGTICSQATDFLPRSIKGFLEEMPDVDVQVYEASSHAILKLLDKGIVEAGIIKEPFNHNLYDYIYCEKTPEECQFIAVGLPSYLPVDKDTISLRSLKKLPLIVHRIHKDMLVQACNHFRFDPHIVCTDENVMTSLIWASEGLGVALLPASGLHHLHLLSVADSLHYCHLKTTDLLSQTALVYKKDTTRSLAMEKYLAYCKNLLSH